MRSIPYKEYFDKMSLTDRQKQERIRAAQDFEEVFLLFLLLLAIQHEHKVEITATDDFIANYTGAVKKYLDDDDFAVVYVTMIAALLKETTIEHIDDEYYTSLDRAMVLAENEANTVLNEKDYQDAVALGYTRKQWITERDNRVRPTHEEVDSVTIPINELFVVGNAVMRYPHDVEMAGEFPEELSNCRCSVAYLK